MYPDPPYESTGVPGHLGVWLTDRGECKVKGGGVCVSGRPPYPPGSRPSPCGVRRERWPSDGCVALLAVPLPAGLFVEVRRH